MNLRVEFDYDGRCYTVESPSIQLWNVYAVARLQDKMTIETDLRSGESIFVTWSQVGVIRLVSLVNEKGHATGLPSTPAPSLGNTFPTQATGRTTDDAVGAPRSAGGKAARNISSTPGWYADPDRQPGEAFRRRYWDGAAWTDRFD